MTPTPHEPLTPVVPERQENTMGIYGRFGNGPGKSKSKTPQAQPAPKPARLLTSRRLHTAGRRPKRSCWFSGSDTVR